MWPWQLLALILVPALVALALDRFAAEPEPKTLQQRFNGLLLQKDAV